MNCRWLSLLMLGIVSCVIQPTIAEAQSLPTEEELDIKPEIKENSPVLQRWLKEIPDVLEEINQDPAFVTRLRFGYSQFPSDRNMGGYNFAIEDIFLARTGLTLSADYQATIDSNLTNVGADLHYYLLPLGWYVNLAPLIGYRYVQVNDFNTEGVNIGARLMLVFSRGGAADISITQSFVSVGSAEEVGITTLSVGYALTSFLRLSTDIQQQNSPQAKDSRVGIVLEIIP